ncbi:hypothetical protein V8C86DRAFT_3103731 [Haematococcus lacustris]
MLAVRVFVVAVMLASASAQSDFLTLHNAYRERHQVAPLTSNAALTSAAQSWANSLADYRFGDNKFALLPLAGEDEAE